MLYATALPLLWLGNEDMTRLGETIWAIRARRATRLLADVSEKGEHDNVVIA